MDEYLAKPIRPGELVHMVERVAGSASPAGPLRGTRPTDLGPLGATRPAGLGDATAEAPVVFAIDRALERVDGDERLLREAIAIVQADTPAMVQAVRDAATAGDVEALRRAAHALKGSLGTIDAARAFAAAARLEDAAARHDLPAAAGLVDELLTEIRQLDKTLSTLTSGKGARRRT